MIPEDGSQFELEADGLHIKVLQVKEHRIEGTLVRVLPKEPEEEAEKGKKNRKGLSLAFSGAFVYTIAVSRLGEPAASKL